MCFPRLRRWKHISTIFLFIGTSITYYSHHAVFVDAADDAAGEFAVEEVAAADVVLDEDEEAPEFLEDVPDELPAEVAEELLLPELTAKTEFTSGRPFLNAAKA